MKAATATAATALAVPFAIGFALGRGAHPSDLPPGGEPVFALLMGVALFLGLWLGLSLFVVIFWRHMS